MQRAPRFSLSARTLGSDSLRSRFEGEQSESQLGDLKYADRVGHVRQVIGFDCGTARRRKKGKYISFFKSRCCGTLTKEKKIGLKIIVINKRIT